MPDSSSRFELTLDDERFPDGVRELEDAPERLYAWGNLDVLNAPALAVIGARSATPYGIAVAEIAGRVAAQSSVAVVSGGARGCDAAAGAAALDAGGVHIAVLGCGADVVDPRSSATLLARTIEAGGLILSLDPWGSPPRKWAFPRRNRVIAALSSAVMITEAGLPSGTFSTAETAMDLGRELLAVPGSILSPQSRGSNHLIGLGATCIADEEELEMAISRIYGTLRFSRPQVDGVPDLDDRAERVVEALIASPMRADELARMLEMDARACLTFLSDLMVRGLIERLLDGRFAPTKIALLARTPFGHNAGGKLR